MIAIRYCVLLIIVCCTVMEIVVFLTSGSKQSNFRKVFKGRYGTMSKTFHSAQVSSNTSPDTSKFMEIQMPVQHFVMTKVEKTGSSTMYSILARFIIRHNLTVLAPLRYRHIHWNQSEFTIGPGNHSQADTLINHAIYKRDMVDKYIKSDYKHVALVREPVSWFKSACGFFKTAISRQYNKRIITNLTIDDITLKDDTLFLDRLSNGEGPKTFFHLSQLQWYGFNYTDRDNLTAIQEFVTSLVSRVDVIILNDQFDASLLILKKKFGWTYLDIFYTARKVRNSSQSTMSEKAIRRLLSKDVNFGDKLLYDSMSSVWWKQLELRENNFWEEVSYFKELNKNVTKLCKEKDGLKERQLTVSASRWHDSFGVPQEVCSCLKKDASVKGFVALIGEYSARGS